MAKIRAQLAKTPTGIVGLDEITGGGFPQGRPTLLCGSAGCGKTLLAMEFLVRGATQFHEPGVFVAFEETAADLTANVASLGFDLPQLLESQIAAPRAEFELQEAEYRKHVNQDRAREVQLTQDQMQMGLSRKADKKPNGHRQNGASK